MTTNPPPLTGKPRLCLTTGQRVLGLLLTLGISACVSVRLEDHAVRAASTLTDLQYKMVLDNLAMMAANPDRIPWHIKLDGGSVQISDQVGAELGILGLTWRSGYDAVDGRFLLFPERQTTDQWDFVPVTNPTELRNLQAAYQKALGLKLEEDLLKDLHIPDNWFSKGGRADVPADTAYSGQYRDHFVWVTSDHLRELSKFTLTVLSIVEFKADERTFRRGIISSPR